MNHSARVGTFLEENLLGGGGDFSNCDLLENVCIFNNSRVSDIFKIGGGILQVDKKSLGGVKSTSGILRQGPDYYLLKTAVFPPCFSVSFTFHYEIWH